MREKNESPLVNNAHKEMVRLWGLNQRFAGVSETLHACANI
jgi:hypothetical protein